MPARRWWRAQNSGRVVSGFSRDSWPVPSVTNPPPSAARARIAPAGLMFLAITSVGWGFNWPVTKYLIGELPPLTLRGVTGVVGAALLATLALARGQSLNFDRALWPRLMLASLLNV